MSIQQLKDEAAVLSPVERRELIGQLVALGRETGTARPLGDRAADFLAWANRPRPQVGLRDAGRDTIYEG